MSVVMEDQIDFQVKCRTEDKEEMKWEKIRCTDGVTEAKKKVGSQEFAKVSVYSRAILISHFCSISPGY